MNELISGALKLRIYRRGQLWATKPEISPFSLRTDVNFCLLVSDVKFYTPTFKFLTFPFSDPEIEKDAVGIW